MPGCPDSPASLLMDPFAVTPCVPQLYDPSEAAASVPLVTVVVAAGTKTKSS